MQAFESVKVKAHAQYQCKKFGSLLVIIDLLLKRSIIYYSTLLLAQNGYS